MRHGKDLRKNTMGKVYRYSKGGTVGWVVLRVVFHSCQGRLQIAGGGRAGVDDGQDRSQLGDKSWKGLSRVCGESSLGLV